MLMKMLTRNTPRRFLTQARQRANLMLDRPQALVAGSPIVVARQILFLGQGQPEKVDGQVHHEQEKGDDGGAGSCRAARTISPRSCVVRRQGSGSLGTS